MRASFLFFCLPLSLLAQSEPTPPTARDITTQRAAALEALKANKVDVAEQKLSAIASSQEAQSPEARVERAQEWITLAFRARAAGDIVAAQRAATRALGAIAQAEKSWRDNPKNLAELQLMRATVQEEFLGTSETAETCIEAAARLDQENPAARAQAERIKRRRDALATTETKPLAPATAVPTAP